MLGPQPGRLFIADAQRQLRAVDDVGQEQGAQIAHGVASFNERVRQRKPPAMPILVR
jgi:hypothetical protein